MRRSAFDESRDQRIAEEVNSDRKLMCSAAGCPNRWTVDAGNGRACSAHAWADAKQWPAITREQQARESDRAMYGATTQKPVRYVSKAEALEKLATLRLGSEPMNPIGWALKLKERDEAGERLTITQREMYQRTLKHKGLM